MTKKKHRVPVAIYEGLERKIEVSLFIDINTTQRGVPAALLLDIKNLAERESEIEVKLRELFDFLGTTPDSPLNGLTSPAQSMRGKIARPTFNKAVGAIFSNAVIERLSKEKQFELFKNYLRAVENNLSDPHLLVIAAYFESVVGLFDDVLHLSRQNHRDYKYDSLCKVLSPLKNLDLTQIMTGGRTRLNKATILPALKELITGQIDVNENMV